MKAVSAQAVSCCVCDKPKINNAAHARKLSILVRLLGRSNCSSPFTKEHHALGSLRLIHSSADSAVEGCVLLQKNIKFPIFTLMQSTAESAASSVNEPFSTLNADEASFSLVYMFGSSISFKVVRIVGNLPRPCRY